MHLPFVVARITRLTVTATGESGAVPTLTLDEELMRQTGLRDSQLVLVLASEGRRLEVMLRTGRHGTGAAILSGTSLLVSGDVLDLVVQGFLDERELGSVTTHQYHLDEQNRVARVLMGRI